MWQYLTPSTLEEMYKDLDDARLEVLRQVNEENFWDKTNEYKKLTDLVCEINDVYEGLTGNPLWALAAVGNA